MIGVVVCRDGVLPAGALEVVAECDGQALVIGTGSDTAASALHGFATEVTLIEAGPFAVAHYRDLVANATVAHGVLVMPASADGRDLAPRVAAATRRPLIANASRVERHRVDVVRPDGRAMQQVSPPDTFVATLLPGVRGALATVDHPPRFVDASTARLDHVPRQFKPDATSVAVLPADVGSIDLSEARRIVAGGAGLDSARRFDQLSRLGARLGASVGATRVITDRQWVGHSRQIGTTGVVVDPELYLALGISGAVQHTAGIGNPAHVVSVNIDPYCPMMDLADLAVVADANAVLDELEAELDRRLA